jgi:hypothetical protein
MAARMVEDSKKGAKSVWEGSLTRRVMQEVFEEAKKYFQASSEDAESFVNDTRTSKPPHQITLPTKAVIPNSTETSLSFFNDNQFFPSSHSVAKRNFPQKK